MSTEALAGAVACTSSNNPYGAHPMAKSGGLDLCIDSNGTTVECFMERVCDSGDTENQAFAIVNSTSAGTNDWVIFVKCNTAGTFTNYCAVYEDTNLDRTGLAVYGTDNRDLIRFQDANGTLDTVPGGQNLDGYAYGDAGDDFLVGSTTINANYTDILNGVTGMDYLFGQAGQDKLYGGQDNDYVDSGSDNDVLLEGNDGDDIVVAGGGSDGSVEGNGGHDYICGHTANNIPVSAGAPSFSLAAGYSIDPQTWLTASTPLVCVTSGSGEETIRAGAGDDTVFSANGDDDVSGGTGQDILWLGAGNDRSCDPAEDNDEVYGETGGDELYAILAGGTVMAAFDGGGQSGDQCSAWAGLTVTNCPGAALTSNSCPF